VHLRSIIRTTLRPVDPALLLPKGPFGQTMSLVLSGGRTMSLIKTRTRGIKRDIKRGITVETRHNDRLGTVKF
jgi:hypothetical protein